MLQLELLEVIAHKLVSVREMDKDGGTSPVVPATLAPLLDSMRAQGLPYTFIAELHALLESSANPHVVPHEAHLASKDEVFARITSVILLLTIGQVEAIRFVYEMLLSERRASDAGVPGARKKSEVAFDLWNVQSFYLLARKLHGLDDKPRVP